MKYRRTIPSPYTTIGDVPASQFRGMQDPNTKIGFALANIFQEEHFKPLFELLPSLRRPPPPLPNICGPLVAGCRLVLFANPPEVDDLIALCHDLKLVNPYNWNEFIRDVPFLSDPSLIGSFDKENCFKAITAIIRADRFSPGTVHGCWGNGTLSRVVERIHELV